jgi:hypothetical protein
VKAVNLTGSGQRYRAFPVQLRFTRMMKNDQRCGGHSGVIYTGTADERLSGSEMINRPQRRAAPLRVSRQRTLPKALAELIGTFIEVYHKLPANQHLFSPGRRRRRHQSMLRPTAGPQVSRASC